MSVGGRYAVVGDGRFPRQLRENLLQPGHSRRRDARRMNVNPHFGPRKVGVRRRRGPIEAGDDDVVVVPRNNLPVQGCRSGPDQVDAVGSGILPKRSGMAMLQRSGRLGIETGYRDWV